MDRRRHYICIFFCFQSNKLKFIVGIMAEQKISEQQKLSFLLPTAPHLTPFSQLHVGTSSSGWVYSFCIWVFANKTGGLLYLFFPVQDGKRDEQKRLTSVGPECCIFYIWGIKLKCRNGLILAHTRHFKATVQMSGRLFCTLRQIKIQFACTQCTIWYTWCDKAAWGHKVPFASSELDLLLSSMKLQVYGNSNDWVSHVPKIKIRSERGLTKNNQHREYVCVPSCTHLCSCCLLLPVPSGLCSAFSPTLNSYPCQTLRMCRVA